ncbi:Xaa-Pro peptidase family protein [Bacillus sp. CGMCC 1.16541]|uniref:M24 family metallopeptidase n=1 Tax=Bacillus sp. CGMCC 1.16541 TaxID=2185143 RepID=UPI000D73EA99|nr:Xaa-Pro peptidase family protein [Bacillus sp. CGMCC 1.16541]
MQQRLQQVIDWLKENKQDFSFIHSTENVFYLTGFYTNPHERLLGLFVFPEAEPLLVCPAMEVNQAKSAGWEYEVLGYEDHENPWELLKESLHKRNVTTASTIAVEKELLSYARAEELLKIYSTATLVNAEEKLNELRVVKEPLEIDVLKQAAELADYGVQVGVEALQEGVTEMDVLAKIEYELKRKGIREMSFSTMVLFGEKSGEPHGNPGLRTLKKGDFVLFDLGVVLNGYCSDITRTVAFGHVSDKQREIYETVKRAQQAALDASKPGTRIGDLDIIARNIITEAGYGHYFPHRLGHGLGINVHEFPSMSKTNNDVLKEGMVYTIEPGIYIPEIGGVRIEDDVVITKDGAKTLTNYPKELQII